MYVACFLDQKVQFFFCKGQQGPFKCYVTQMGVGWGGGQIFRKKRYKGVRFNVISITTRGWVGVQFPEKNVK